MIDMFFLIDKSNALLKATGWADLHLSVNINMRDMIIKITAHLNNKPINTASLPYNTLYDTTLTAHNKLIGRLHEFAINSYDIYKEVHKC
jgi:hypothetical protein